MNILELVNSLTELERKTLNHYWHKCFGPRQRKSFEGYMDDQAECVMCDDKRSDFAPIAERNIMRGVLTSLNKKGILWPDSVNNQYNAWFVTEAGWRVMQAACSEPEPSEPKIDVPKAIERIREYIAAVRARDGAIVTVEILTSTLEAIMDSHDLLVAEVMKTCPICRGTGMDADAEPCVVCLGGGKL